jgi:hypothetical protein
LIVDAHDRAAKGTATYMATAKARSVIANVAAQNQALAEIGLPPLQATVSPGHTTASVKVAGKMLTDFPLVARDWDPSANDRPLASVKAGSGYDAHADEEGHRLLALPQARSLNGKDGNHRGLTRHGQAGAAARRRLRRVQVVPRAGRARSRHQGR